MTDTNWLEFKVEGPVETMRYRTNEDASIVYFWSDYRIYGICGTGWTRTKSATVTMRARKALKEAKCK